MPNTILLGFFLIILQSYGCKSMDGRNSRSKVSGLGDGDSAAGLSALDQNSLIKVMAAASAAAYCGPDAGCTESERFNQRMAELSVTLPEANFKFASFMVSDSCVDGEGFVMYAENSSDVVISFRGSETSIGTGAIKDWLCTDADSSVSKYPAGGIKGGVHNGFNRAAEETWGGSNDWLTWNNNKVINIINDNGLWQKNFFVTGHSLGAAMGALIALKLKIEGKRVQKGIFFGMPRIGNQEFKDSYNNYMGKDTVTSIINDADAVPRINPKLFGVGSVLALQQGNLRSDSNFDQRESIPLGFNGLTEHMINCHMLDKIPEGYLPNLKILGGLEGSPPRS